MKYLIVNGDDFGASRGINRGIVRAHRRGILTSTSLMVNMPAAEEAAGLGRECPALGIGLHVALTNEDEQSVVNLDDAADCRRAVGAQFERFVKLVGRAPTHLDSHHNIHCDPRVLPHFLELSREHDLPLRHHSPARYFSKFYGQWDGVSHFEQVSVESLLAMLGTELETPVTELSCHPGYTDPDFTSFYSAEREAELRTLCDPAVRAFLEQRGVRLINFSEVKSIARAAN